jgi:predicted nucleic acid-binding protein
MAITYAVKVEGGKAKLYDAKTGAFKRSGGSNVVSAQIVGEMVQVTEKKGSVKIYDANTGAFKRSL